MRHNSVVAAMLAMLVSALVSVAAAADAEYEAAVFKGEGDKTLNYRLLKPQNYDAAKKYPLVLFLHGAGERGNDNKAQLKHVAGVFLLPENREKFPCFVLAPQCPSNEKWADVNWGAKTHSLPEKAASSMALTLATIEQLKKQYSIDGKRLYVMGLSMGGYGTWDVVARYPEMFAAAVPICGGGDEAQAEKLVKLPIWCFHGGNDTVVPTARSRNMIEAIKKAGGNPKYTEFPGVGHDSWTPATKDAELLPWLFGQKRS